MHLSGSVSATDCHIVLRKESTLYDMLRDPDLGFPILKSGATEIPRFNLLDPIPKIDAKHRGPIV